MKATARISLLLTAGALAATPLVSRSVAAGLAIGFLAGALNPLLTRATLRRGVPFRAVSLLRLILLSVLAAGAGVLLGAPWAPPAGLALCQLVLLANASWAAVRR